MQNCGGGCRMSNAFSALNMFSLALGHVDALCVLMMHCVFCQFVWASSGPGVKYTNQDMGSHN